MKKSCKEVSRNTGSDKISDNATGQEREKNAYLSLVESTTDSLYLVDRNCRYIFLNRNHLTRLGLLKEEVIGRSYSDYHPPTQSKAFAKNIEDVFTSGMSFQHELKSEKDGRHFLRTFNPVKEASPDGRVVAVAVASKDITELKQSEEKYQTIIESIEDGYYELDLAGHITFCNEACRRIYGSSREEMSGMNALKLADEETAKKLYQYYNKIYTTGKPLGWVAGEIIRKDGTRRKVEASASLIKNLTGQPIGFRGIVRDVTEHRQAEELYKTLAESSLAAVFIVQDGKFRFINTSAIAYAGYSAEELIGRDSDMIVHPDDRELVGMMSRDMLAERSNQAFEFRMVTKQKEIRWISQTVTPIQYEGNPAILGNAIDVTEHKQIEELYETLAENSLAAVFIVQDGKFRFINTSAIAYAGYSAEELIGRDSDMIVHPDDRELVGIKSREMLAGRSNQAFEFRMVTKQNEKRWISQTVTPIHYEGKPAILGNAIDVTELKWAEEALKESEQRLHDIINFLPDATYAIDREGKVIAWNRAIEEMTGVKAVDMLGKGDYEYAIPFYGMRRPQLINLVFLSGKDIEEKYAFVKKEGDVLIAEADVPVGGGTPRTLWGIARPLYDSKGNIVGAIESIRDVSERKQMEETVKWLAFHDGLTGLPNRRLYSDRLTMALAHVRRNRRKLCVIILDLDKFKLINDTLGHPVGDRLLQAVGERLSKILRTEDTVARIGGDEFMLLLPEINRDEDVIIVAERILGAFQQPFKVDGYELHVTTSVGYAVYPDDGDDADTLIKNSDIAMYIAKERGRNRYQRFLPTQDK